MRITLTGADEKTAIDDLVALVDAIPMVEIGLLFTATPEGRNRYPSMDWLTSAASALSGRCAVHICGGGARAMLLAGELSRLTRHAPRIQVNGVVGAGELPGLATQVDTLITQHCPANQGLVLADVKNHALLIDGSGGRGISPDIWSRPVTDKPVGFAGGLGLANLEAELCKIALVADGDWWIDMEGKLRVDDWFDLVHARSVAHRFQSILESGKMADTAVI